MKSCQVVEDRETEQLWIQKESRIRWGHNAVRQITRVQVLLIGGRTMSYIVIMDNDFHLRHGFPPRMRPSGLSYGLPSPATLSSATHPYRDLEFSFKQRSTIDEAFRALFLATNTLDHADNYTQGYLVKDDLLANFTNLDLLVLAGCELFAMRTETRFNTDCESNVHTYPSVYRACGSRFSITKITRRKALRSDT